MKNPRLMLTLEKSQKITKKKSLFPRFLEYIEYDQIFQ